MALTNFVNKITVVSAAFLNAVDIVKEAIVNAPGALTYPLASVGGTATAITATSLVPITQYTAGQIFTFRAVLGNGINATLNVSGIGALLLTDGSATPLVGSEMLAGQNYMVVVQPNLTEGVLLNPNVLKSRGLEVGTRFQTVQSGIVASVLVAQTDDRSVLIYQGTGGHTFTFPNTGITPGSMFEVVHLGTAATTIILVTSGTMLWLNGGGTGASGNRTLARDGNAIIQYINAGSSIMVKGVGLS